MELSVVNFQRRNSLCLGSVSHYYKVVLPNNRLKLFVKHHYGSCRGPRYAETDRLMLPFNEHQTSIGGQPFI